MIVTATTHHGNFRHVETVDVASPDALRDMIAAGPYKYPHALSDLVLVAGLFDSLQHKGEAWHGWTHYTTDALDEDCCRGCGRDELTCSMDPCPDVIEDRES